MVVVFVKVRLSVQITTFDFSTDVAGRKLI